MTFLSRSLSRGHRGPRGPEHEAKSSTGGDRSLRARSLELLAKSRDVSIDDVGAGIEMHVPDFFSEIASRNSLAGVKHQMLEKLELSGSEVHLVGTERYASR